MSRSTVAGYLRRLDNEQRAVAIERLKENLRFVRQNFSGYEARDGYALNGVKSLSKSAADAINARAQYARELQARPNIVVQPRSQATKHQIIRHTRQQQYKNQKKFFVHTSAPDRTRVKVTRNKVEVFRKSVDASGKEHLSRRKQYFLNFGRKRVTWEMIVEKTETMRRGLPNGLYRIISSIHGPIYAPVLKRMLTRQMERWFDTYGNVTGKEEFPDTILGFEFLAFDEKQAVHRITQAEEIRENLRVARERQARKHRELIRKRLVKRGRKAPK